jgi:hypothetical protein
VWVAPHTVPEHSLTQESEAWEQGGLTPTKMSEDFFLCEQTQDPLLKADFSIFFPQIHILKF